LSSERGLFRIKLETVQMRGFWRLCRLFAVAGYMFMHVAHAGDEHAVHTPVYPSR
jgi:hypothetical protein